ncbi:MAG: hypothetical protein H7Y31_13095 [Chitinophagaceae bacterium]|nr:hypothetical protein [Chitinophagaceae bacterium]
MRKSILLWGVCLLAHAYAYAQIESLQSDEIDTDHPFTILMGASSPVNGPMTAHHPETNVRYNGNIKNSLLHGNWQSWFGNDVAFEKGSMVKGIPTGEWKVWYPDGTLRFVRTYSADKFQRVKQELKRRHPKMPGFPISDLYAKDRNSALTRLRSSYSFRNSGINNKYNPIFKDCLHHGQYINYFEDGRLKDSGYYQNGLRHGVWFETVEAGTAIETGAYKHGQRSGTWKIMNAQRKLIALIHYKNGKASWQKNY